jgi:hypothetical protein
LVWLLWQTGLLTVFAAVAGCTQVSAQRIKSRGGNTTVSALPSKWSRSQSAAYSSTTWKLPT